jgi:hypothetical protein
MKYKHVYLKDYSVELETGSLQVANTMRLVLLNVSLHVLVIKSLQETQ